MLTLGTRNVHRAQREIFVVRMRTAPSTGRSSMAMASGASPRYGAQASKSTLLIRIVERF